MPCVIMVGCYLKVFVVMKSQSKRIATSTVNSLANSSTYYPRSFTSSKTDRSLPGTSSSHESDFTNVPQSGRQNVVSIPVKDHQQLLQVRSISAHLTGQDKGTSHTNSRMTSVAPVTSNPRDKKIFITLTYVISSYLICWFPFYVTFDTYAWKPELVPSGLYSFFFWMTYVNSTLNPFIYAYTSKDFRSAFARVIHCAYSCKIK